MSERTSEKKLHTELFTKNKGCCSNFATDNGICITDSTKNVDKLRKNNVSRET